MRLEGQENRASFEGPDGRAELLRQLRVLLGELSTRSGVVIVVAIGLDRLSQVNDTWGYVTGDHLLEQIHHRLHEAHASVRTAAYLGGDHYALLCLSDEAEDIEAELADGTMRALAGKYEVDGHDIYVTTSVGVAATADAGDDPEQLMSAAVTARVEAHRNGGRRWARADQVMRIRIREQHRTEQALHQALDLDELALCYQPIVNLATGTTAGFEALARWQSASLGNIPPSYFIPRAEQTGLIVPLGHWVLDQLARDWSAVQAPSGFAAPLLAVNVSSVQLRLDLVELVRHLTRTALLVPGQLWVEITESAFLEDAENFRETLEELKSLGVHLVIDDFGTGYSALSELRTLPVDAIKVDQVFVGRIHEDPRDRAIVQAMIHLAKALGILAIAEGVENVAQLTALQEMGCDQVQGFHFAPALSIVRAQALFEDRPTKWLDLMKQSDAQRSPSDVSKNRR